MGHLSHDDRQGQQISPLFTRVWKDDILFKIHKESTTSSSDKTQYAKFCGSLWATVQKKKKRRKNMICCCGNY